MKAVHIFLSFFSLVPLQGTGELYSPEYFRTVQCVPSSKFLCKCASPHQLSRLWRLGQRKKIAGMGSCRVGSRKKWKNSRKKQMTSLTGVGGVGLRSTNWASETLGIPR